MDLNFSVFQEPRGVMRILQLVFTISAFAAIAGFSGNVNFKCDSINTTYNFNFDYPFDVLMIKQDLNPSGNATACHPLATINGDFSSDAQFFVATGVLAMLYALGIIFVYVKMDASYKSNSQLPLVDFVLTVIFAVLWLSSSAAWANGLSGLKHITDSDSVTYDGITNECKKCLSYTSSFSTLNISVVLGFLNFFLWASDLWFVYKETAWFQGNQGINSAGV